MENILKYLADPSWWFSVVFVGFLIAFFAPFLQRIIMKFLSYFSSGIRKRRENSKCKMTERIDRISKDTNRLLIHFVLTGIVLQIFGFCVLFSILIIIWFNVGFPGKATMSMLDKISTLVAISFLFLTGIGAMFLVAFRLEIGMRAFRKYRERKKTEEKVSG